MDIYPAIDLRGGHVVRLMQGDYDKMTVYGDDPLAQARRFAADGARFLHLVDLDGAKDGAPVNLAAIEAIAQTSGLAVEVGGGIRTEERIEAMLALGVRRCILGTIAVKDLAFTRRMIARYGERIAVGVDARNGKVATAGWLEESELDGVDFCRRLADAGCAAVIYTDISRDGAMQGTNLPLYERLVREVPGLAVTASGGIASMAELKALDAMGVAAAVLGKSLYTGAIDLKEAVQVFTSL